MGGLVDGHGQRLAHHVLGLLGAKGQRRHRAVGGISQLERGLERVLAEDVGHQIGTSAFCLFGGRVDPKITRRHVRVQDLLHTHQNVHAHLTLVD